MLGTVPPTAASSSPAAATSSWWWWCDRGDGSPPGDSGDFAIPVSVLDEACLHSRCSSGWAPLGAGGLDRREKIPEPVYRVRCGAVSRPWMTRYVIKEKRLVHRMRETTASAPMMASPALRLSSSGARSSVPGGCVGP